MKLTFLGTGTSTGVPVIGCSCSVCLSENLRNTRSRPSVLIQSEEGTVLVDIGPDFRYQALKYKFSRVDAVLLTHGHADHIMGFDDIRMFNFYQKGKIPVYGSMETLKQVRRTFWYAFEETQEGGGKPGLDLRPVDSVFRVAGIDFIPVPICHGNMDIFGYRFGNVAYLTDCSAVPDLSYSLLEGLELLIIGALRYTEHPTHMSLEQALEECRRINPAQVLLTHMNHELDYGELNDKLPSHINMAYDGLVI